MPSSWKHPAVPYEVLIDPLSMRIPQILNVGRTGNNSDTKVRCVAKTGCLEFPDAELNCSGGVFSDRDAQIVLVLVPSIYTAGM